VKAQLLYPRGNALTDSMPFTDRDEVRWLVYIEGIPPDPLARRWHQTVLPGRRLRFDSATESRTSIQVPAGSPYLTARRLQSLLDQAQPLLVGPEAPAMRAPLPRPGESGARRERPGAAASEALRRLWRWASDPAPPLLGRALEQFLSAVLAMMEALEGVMRSRVHRVRR
jgi:hypothetical protein